MDNTPTHGHPGGPTAPGEAPPPPLPWQQGGQPTPWSPPVQPPPGHPPAQSPVPPQAFPPGQNPPRAFAPPQNPPPVPFAPQTYAQQPASPAAPPPAPSAYPPRSYPPAGPVPTPLFGGPVSTPPYGGPPPLSPTPARRRWVAVLAGALVLVILAAGGVVAWRLMGDDGTPIADPSATAAQNAGQSPAPAPPSVSVDATPGDEFDGASLNEPKWGIYGSTSPNGSVWSRDAVTVRDGILRITGTGRNPTGSGNVAGGVCWCGPGGNRTSGVWTVRARFDAGAGYGPGLMLWPESDKASDGFATFAGVNDPDRRTVRSLVMWGTAGGKAEATLAGDFTQWHVYRVEWRAGSLKMYVDEQVLFDSATRPGVVVPSTPMHLVIQVVAGPKDGVPAANAGTPEKVVTEVDWVRYTP